MRNFCSPGQRRRAGAMACGFGLCVFATPVLAADAGTGFNPKISLVLQGTYANYSNDRPPVIPGFLLSSGAEFRPSGFSLRETELSLESNVDDYFHAFATIALDNEPNGDTTVGVEEAFINTLTLPYGLTAKFGRFFSDIGYQNHIHTHAWDFVDAPLVYHTTLGDQLGDDGVQLKWILPLDLFVEVGAEALRGAAFPGGGGKRSGVPAKSIFVHHGSDINASSSYRVGLSYLRVDDGGRRSDDELGSTSFAGNTGLVIADLVYKWAPNGNPGARNAVVQGEYFYRRERGDLTFDAANPQTPTTPDQSGYRGNQSGFYIQGIYQFIPHWRAGVRYDRLSASNEVANPAPGTSLARLADNSHAAQRVSLMLDWSRSEFSRIRLQYNRDQSRPGGDADNQVFVQTIFSIGAHPAHTF